MPTHHQGPPEEVRALNTFIKLIRAADSLQARTSRPLDAAGLTAGQFGVLEALFHLGPLHQRELARKHLQSGGNMTMIVNNLEKAGLVRRKRPARDRRYVCVYLTAAGRRHITSIFPGHARNIARHMGALTPGEQEELGRLCRKLGLATLPVPDDASQGPNYVAWSPRRRARRGGTAHQLQSGPERGADDRGNARTPRRPPVKS